MKILVTGADGLLGSNLVRLLLENAYEVTILLHPSSQAETLKGLDIIIEKGDVLNMADVTSASRGCDAIIHAAALTDVWPSRSSKVRKVNIVGTQNMIEAALINNAKRFIYVGSASSASANHGAQYGLDYIDSKYEALKCFQDAILESGLNGLAILPTFMIGAYDSKPSSGKMIQSLAKGKLRFYTQGGRNFVYVKDVAQAIVNSLTKGKLGECYVAGHENMDYKDFFELAAEEIGVPTPKMEIPEWLVKTVGALGSSFGYLTSIAPILSYPMARIATEKQFIDSERAVCELGMPQTDLRIAIRDCYQWFKENGYC